MTWGSLKTSSIVLIGPAGTLWDSQADNNSDLLSLVVSTSIKSRQGRSVFDAFWVGFETCISGPICVKYGCEFLELAVVAHGQNDVAVAGFDHAIGHDVRVVVTLAVWGGASGKGNSSPDLR